jgi:hypothetical protein
VIALQKIKKTYEKLEKVDTNVLPYFLHKKSTKASYNKKRVRPKNKSGKGGSWVMTNSLEYGLEPDRLII